MNEIVRHESNGMLFERGNAGALATVVERLCKDPGMLKRLTDNCKPLLSMDDYIDQLEQIYGSVCSEKRDRSLLMGIEKMKLVFADNRDGIESA